MDWQVAGPSTTSSTDGIQIHIWSLSNTDASRCNKSSSEPWNHVPINDFNFRKQINIKHITDNFVYYYLEHRWLINGSRSNTLNKVITSQRTIFQHYRHFEALFETHRSDGQHTLSVLSSAHQHVRFNNACFTIIIINTTMDATGCSKWRKLKMLHNTQENSQSVNVFLVAVHQDYHG